MERWWRVYAVPHWFEGGARTAHHLTGNRTRNRTLIVITSAASDPWQFCKSLRISRALLANRARSCGVAEIGTMARKGAILSQEIGSATHEEAASTDPLHRLQNTVPIRRCETGRFTDSLLSKTAFELS